MHPDTLRALEHARQHPNEVTVWHAGSAGSRRESRPIYERLLAGVDTSDEDACWTVTSQPSQTYANMSIANRSMTRHRVSFFLRNGWLPPVVRHSCDNPPCVNPAHLVGGTSKDNSADMVQRGRHAGTKLRREACRRGHALKDPNLYYDKDGGRQCRACSLMRNSRQPETIEKVEIYS